MSESPPLFVHRRGSFLAPWSPLDEASIAAFPLSKRLRARLTQPRNEGRLRLYFALIDLVRSNMDNPPLRQTMHDGVKIRLGLTTPVRFADGTVREVPRSVAFDAMPEEDFREFFEAFKALIHSSPAMEKAATEMLGGEL